MYAKLKCVTEHGVSLSMQDDFKRLWN